jgi:hypothetical protein
MSAEVLPSRSVSRETVRRRVVNAVARGPRFNDDVLYERSIRWLYEQAVLRWIEFRCYTCGRFFEVLAANADRVRRCPYCGAHV